MLWWDYYEWSFKELWQHTREMLTRIVPEAIERELWLTKEEFDKMDDIELYFLNRKYMFSKWFRWSFQRGFYLPNEM